MPSLNPRSIAPSAEARSPLIAVDAAKAAQLLDVSKRFFHELRKRPGFPSGRALGRAVRWNPDQLKEWFLSLPAAERRDEPAQLQARRFRDGKPIGAVA